jgi:ribokinase
LRTRYCTFEARSHTLPFGGLGWAARRAGDIVDRVHPRPVSHHNHRRSDVPKSTPDRPRLTVLGSLNMDLIVRTGHLPAPGETTLGSAFATSQGGKGANQAIAAARAGALVAMIGAVGIDGFGDQLTECLAAEDISTLGLRHVPGPSGIAVITVDDSAENTIVVAPGANLEMTDLTDRDHAAIADSAILLLQLEIPIETVTAGAQTAAAVGVPVLLNPSPVLSLPPELLAAVTIVVLNEGERSAIGDEILDRIPHVVTTLGAAGARYRGPNGETAIARPPAVSPIDTTGAGDAFTGALAVSWIEGAPPNVALNRACVAGALATTKRGAGVAAPTRAEIDRFSG